VKAPRSYPKISDSNSVSGSAAQLTAWKRASVPATELVDHARHDLLAGAGRAQDEHRDVGLRRRADPLEHDEHLLVAADHLAEPLDGRRLVFGADGGAALEERLEQGAGGNLRRPHAGVARRRAGQPADDPEGGELAHAVLDVEPHAPERRHQRLGVERLVESAR
jgi:hypothetical protein